VASKNELDFTDVFSQWSPDEKVLVIDWHSTRLEIRPKLKAEKAIDGGGRNSVTQTRYCTTRICPP